MRYPEYNIYGKHDYKIQNQLRKNTDCFYLCQQKILLIQMLTFPPINAPTAYIETWCFPYIMKNCIFDLNFPFTLSIYVHRLLYNVWYVLRNHLFYFDMKVWQCSFQINMVCETTFHHDELWNIIHRSLFIDN